MIRVEFGNESVPQLRLTFLNADIALPPCDMSRAPDLLFTVLQRCPGVTVMAPIILAENAQAPDEPLPGELAPVEAAVPIAVARRMRNPLYGSGQGAPAGG